jgi:hypothetical protein
VPRTKLNIKAILVSDSFDIYIAQQILNLSDDAARAKP